MAWTRLRRSAGTANERCRCGHEREAHLHYRTGTDCAICAPGACRRFSPTR